MSQRKKRQQGVSATAPHPPPPGLPRDPLPHPSSCPGRASTPTLLAFQLPHPASSVPTLCSHHTHTQGIRPLLLLPLQLHSSDRERNGLRLFDQSSDCERRMRVCRCGQVLQGEEAERERVCVCVHHRVHLSTGKCSQWLSCESSSVIAVVVVDVWATCVVWSVWRGVPHTLRIKEPELQFCFLVLGFPAFLRLDCLCPVWGSETRRCFRHFETCVLWHCGCGGVTVLFTSVPLCPPPPPPHQPSPPKTRGFWLSCSHSIDSSRVSAKPETGVFLFSMKVNRRRCRALGAKYVLSVVDVWSGCVQFCALVGPSEDNDAG